MRKLLLINPLYIINVRIHVVCRQIIKFSSAFLFLFLLSCGSDNVTGPYEYSQFPLTVGTVWRYLDRVEYVQPGKGFSTVSTDTLQIKVLTDIADGWKSIELRYTSQGKPVLDTCYFKNTDTGMYAKNYYESAGSMLLFKKSADTNTQALLIPTDKSPSSWVMYSGRIAKKGASEVIVNNGKPVECRRIDYYSGDLLSVNPVWISSTLYSETGIVRKNYKPDTTIINDNVTITNHTVEIIP